MLNSGEDELEYPSSATRKHFLEDLLGCDLPDIVAPVTIDIILAKRISELEQRMHDLEKSMARMEDL